MLSLIAGYPHVVDARLLQDKLYTPSYPGSPAFLIYYISKPLVGISFEPLSPLPAKRSIASFNQLLLEFPSVARTLEPGITNLFSGFLPGEDLATAVEKVISDAISLFQERLGKEQAQLLSQKSTLNGPAIESLIEQYVCENLHDVIFTHIQTRNLRADTELSRILTEVEDLDVDQVGLPILNRLLIDRLQKGMKIFSKLNEALSARGKLKIVLDTMRCLMTDSMEPNEKSNSSSADTLVSLFLLLVIRTKVDRLESNLLYMRNFSLLSTDSGEIGYALSTLEAVMHHLRLHREQLKCKSTANRNTFKCIHLADVRGLEDRLRNKPDDGESNMTSIHCKSVSGDSLAMEAIHSQRIGVLNFLLERLTIDEVLNDMNWECTTLLSASIQSDNVTAVESILRILSTASEERLRKYWAIQDSAGRNAGHYLFHSPSLISRVEDFIAWKSRDRLGQTPLFALCRSYDHPEYNSMVHQGIETIEKCNGGLLVMSDHVDDKGNTLLHIVGNVNCLELLLSRQCNVNALNHKGLTPLMLASKYGRLEMAAALIRDFRMNVYAMDYRGLTAMDLAKDERSRELMENMILSGAKSYKGRRTKVVRVYLTDTCGMGFVIKSALDNSTENTSVRRTLADFGFLLMCLHYEHPSSMVPVLDAAFNPFLIPSKPSRVVAQHAHSHVDACLQWLLVHPTFADHPLLWEFIFIQEFNNDTLGRRTRHVAQSRKETLVEQSTDAESISEANYFVRNAALNVSSLSKVYREAEYYAHCIQNVRADAIESEDLLSIQLQDRHEEHVRKASLCGELQRMNMALDGLVQASNGPSGLAAGIQQLTKQIARHEEKRKVKWPIVSKSSYTKASDQRARLSSELVDAHHVLAEELSSFNETRAHDMKLAIRKHAVAALQEEKLRYHRLLSYKA